MVGIAAPGWRRLLLVAGEPDWGRQWVGSRLPDAVDDALLWVGRDAPAGIAATAPGEVARVLGSEYRLLVVDAHQGFHPDAFAAAVGTLRGGGDCVLLVPPLAAWAAFADPDKQRFAAYPRCAQDMRGLFVERLLRTWCGAAGVVVVEPGAAVSLQIAPAAAGGLRLSDEQQALLAQVERVVLGHARRPLVISADRGRGKSTVLGIAAARLLAQGVPRITVVGAHRAAVQTLFRHALNSAVAAGGPPPAGDIAPRDCPLHGGLLCFRQPHECSAASDEEPGVVFVDEAAAVPVAVLAYLLERSNRLVFASTVHGYEGSGRGFELRFRALLDRRMPQWRAAELRAPVRWAADDPLETLVARALLLDVDLPEVEPGAAGAVTVAPVDVHALADDEDLLRATFGLLVNAHYQTRPSDLRQLLDNPDVRLWLARRAGTVVGVLLVDTEGGIDAAMAQQIVSGARRPRGHLLPQSLAVHAGLDEVLGMRVLRVQRIAVHPALRRAGIGRRLIEAAAEWATADGFDLLGSAFAADPPLLAFWRACGFVPARLGTRIDAASAAHSLFVLRGLNGVGEAVAQRGQKRFLADLPWSLAGSLRTLDAELAVLLLFQRDCADVRLQADECRDLGRVASAARRAGTAEALLWKALVAIAAAGHCAAAELAPLLAWQLQRRSRAEVCRTFAIDGRRALEEHLRAVLAGHGQAACAGG